MSSEESVIMRCQTSRSGGVLWRAKLLFNRDHRPTSRSKISPISQKVNSWMVDSLKFAACDARFEHVIAKMLLLWNLKYVCNFLKAREDIEMWGGARITIECQICMTQKTALINHNSPNAGLLPPLVGNAFGNVKVPFHDSSGRCSCLTLLTSPDPFNPLRHPPDYSFPWLDHSIFATDSWLEV
jgi:hypothetical protein